MVRPLSEREQPSELPEIVVGMTTYVAVVAAADATDQYGLWGWPDVILGIIPALLFWAGVWTYAYLRVKREKAPIIAGIEDLRRDVAAMRRRPS